MENKDDAKVYILRFVIYFILLSIPLYYLLYIGLELRIAVKYVTVHTYLLARLLGVNVFQIDENILYAKNNGDSLQMEIITDCTGWKSMFAFFALVFALPRVGIKKKIKGILFGFPLIYIVNILRLSLLLKIVNIYGSEYFEIWHTFFFRDGLVLFIFLLWVFWVENIVFVGKKANNARHGDKDIYNTEHVGVSDDENTIKHEDDLVEKDPEKKEKLGDKITEDQKNV